MPSGRSDKYDFFLSRRGSVATIAQEVTDVLKENGYRVRTQDYDIPITANFIEEMHEAVKNARDLVVLFTRDYEQSPYTRMEFTSFEANAAQSAEKRRMVILRCEDAPLLGLFAPHVYQDLVGIGDAEERRSRILAAAEGRSQALEPPPRPFIGVPPRIASFTGRADELDRLDAILMRDKPAAVTQASVARAAVHGMGGVGKTSLAVEYAHRYRSLYAGVCWCPAQTRTGLLSALASLAVKLGEVTSEEADVEKAAKAALRRLPEQRATWLLVYDNVPAPEAIADLLPSAGARVLITSRFSDWSELADEVALDVLPLEEAVAFLQNRTRRSDPANAKTLARAVGSLPLALDHAAAYCKRTQMQFGDYAKKASSLIDAAPRGAGYPRSIAATFYLAITEVVTQCQAAEALIGYLAECAPERIPIILVEGAVEDEAERVKALAALAEVSLVMHDPFEDGTPAVKVHRLVQAVARTRSGARTARYAKRFSEQISKIYPIYPKDGAALRNQKDALERLEDKLRPHLQRLAGTHDEQLEGMEGTELIEKTFSNQVSVLENLIGTEHPTTLWSMKVLGDILGGARAVSQYERRVAICEKMLGSNHPHTVQCIYDLGALLEDHGELARARPLLERALAIQEKLATEPESDELLATRIHQLAHLLCEQGELKEARDLEERALQIYQKALGPDAPETANSLNVLGRIVRNQGDLATARCFIEQGLAAREKVLGFDHSDTAFSLHDLALLLRAQGDLKEARTLMERALAIREKKIFEFRYTATSLDDLASLLRTQGDFAKARPLLERALSMRESQLGADHYETNRSRSNLGHVLLVANPRGALELGKTALAAHDKALGRDHAWTKDSARVTADALDSLARTEEAKALRERYGIAGSEDPKRS
jgi:tetratricopeptide (TPR) repeat protein